MLIEKGGCVPKVDEEYDRTIGQHKSAKKGGIPLLGGVSVGGKEKKRLSSYIGGQSMSAICQVRKDCARRRGGKKELHC